ncbi:hypothetical protein MAFF301069_14360 [Ralstonia pseudosolanacearum]|nr:hypothetical protein MAFF211479_15290 [Ralstonia solanacearum]BEU66881.1 hypothetical protein MAFF301069_14360 [Ralstonia pseudosolanacearum]BCL97849.1 hypothetical protein MAFF211491_23010 [Ralstonia solanacearum]BCM13291.1 hypothetical protein MAFF241648_24810 [Ralstonia solanacearum]BCN04392.1 hypothetical protein RPSB_15290 [Ralstonia solanacearum]
MWRIDRVTPARQARQRSDRRVLQEPAFMAKVVLALLVVAAAVFYILFKAPQGSTVSASTPAPAPASQPTASAEPASGPAASAPAVAGAAAAEAPASAAKP